MSFVYIVELPPAPMLQAVQRIITFGVANGNIQKNYSMLGHRQVRDTKCPGDRLFREISKWTNFDPNVS